MARLWIETDAGRAEYTYERRPMEPERFKAVCLLVGFTVYAAMVCVVAWLCGFWALLWLWGFTAVLVLVWLLTHLNL